jgi:hypothetical protein
MKQSSIEPRSPFWALFFLLSAVCWTAVPVIIIGHFSFLSGIENEWLKFVGLVAAAVLGRVFRMVSNYLLRYPKYTKADVLAACDRKFRCLTDIQERMVLAKGLENSFINMRFRSPNTLWLAHVLSELEEDRAICSGGAVVKHTNWKTEGYRLMG